MPSPFPGMDPYLEAPHIWGGVHATLTFEVLRSLNRVLPGGYFAVIDQYVRVVGRDDEDRGLRKPDAFIPEPVPFAPKLNGHAGTAAVLDAPSIEVRFDVPSNVKVRRILIQKAKDRGVLTAVEILSPSNKSAGDDRAAYLRKREEYLASPVNLVEIDLLRGGERVPFGHPDPPDADYYIVSSPADRRPHSLVWAFGVRERLPRFAVPVDAAVGAVPLDLKECFDALYDIGRFAEQVDYTAPADPPLRPADAEWAAELLRAKGAV